MQLLIFLLTLGSTLGQLSLLNVNSTFDDAIALHDKEMANLNNNCYKGLKRGHPLDNLDKFINFQETCDTLVVQAKTDNGTCHRDCTLTQFGLLEYLPYPSDVGQLGVRVSVVEPLKAIYNVGERLLSVESTALKAYIEQSGPDVERLVKSLGECKEFDFNIPKEEDHFCQRMEPKNFAKLNLIVSCLRTVLNSCTDFDQ